MQIDLGYLGTMLLIVGLSLEVFFLLGLYLVLIIVF